MQNHFSPAPGRVLVLGTGGTIAGTAGSSTDNLGYTAAQRGVQDLVAAVPPLATVPLDCEQLAQIDSKDMGFALWQRLAERLAEHLARDDVAGVVVTHGTDTLEETAYFLQRVLAPGKPVVLTAAMRPATALMADGPQNLLDAVQLARTPGARGVLVVVAGQVFSAIGLRKVHTYRLAAFSGGDDGPLARLVEGELVGLRAWPALAPALGLAAISRPVDQWPWVELVTSVAGADGRVVTALLAQGVDGIVVAGTGNGTLHHDLENALRSAEAAGVRVWRSSRCASGGVMGSPAGALPSAGDLTPVQARVAMLLELLAG